VGKEEERRGFTSEKITSRPRNTVRTCVEKKSFGEIGYQKKKQGGRGEFSKEGNEPGKREGSTFRKKTRSRGKERKAVPGAGMEGGIAWWRGGDIFIKRRGMLITERQAQKRLKRFGEKLIFPLMKFL